MPDHTVGRQVEVDIAGKAVGAPAHVEQFALGHGLAAVGCHHPHVHGRAERGIGGVAVAADVDRAAARRRLVVEGLVQRAAVDAGRITGVGRQRGHQQFGQATRAQHRRQRRVLEAALRALQVEVVVAAVVGARGTQHAVGTIDVDEQRVGLQAVQILEVGLAPGRQRVARGALPEAHRALEDVEVGDEAVLRIGVDVQRLAARARPQDVVQEASIGGRSIQLHRVTSALVDRVADELRAAAVELHASRAAGVHQVAAQHRVALGVDAHSVVVDGVATHGGRGGPDAVRRVAVDAVVGARGA